MGCTQQSPLYCSSLHAYIRREVSLHDWYTEGVKRGFIDLVDSTESEVFSRLAQRLECLLNKIKGTASKVGSTQMLEILERLQYKVLRGLELPCCLVVADVDGEVAAYWCDDFLVQ